MITKQDMTAAVELIQQAERLLRGARALIDARRSHHTYDYEYKIENARSEVNAAVTDCHSAAGLLQSANVMDFDD